MIKRIFSFGFITWIAILALGAAVGWQFFFSEKQEAKKIHILETTIEDQQSALKQISSILNTYDQQFKQVADHSNTLVASVKELDAVVQGDSNAWRIIQIQNYLEMAILQASLLNDTRAAINLLTAAQNSMRKIDNPNLIPVRKALQEDLATLATHPTSNVSNIILQLDGISSQVPNLTHKIRLQKEDTPDTPQPNSTAEKWELRAKTAWQEFKSLVRIKRHDQPVTPYFSSDEVWLVNENLQLMLQQAAFAAAHHYTELYQQQLKHAQAWFSLYFDLNDPAVQQAVHTLSELSKLSISTDQNIHLKTVDAWSQFVSSKQDRGQ